MELETNKFCQLDVSIQIIRTQRKKRKSYNIMVPCVSPNLISMKDVITKLLELNANFPSPCTLSYFSPTDKLYVYCGQIPFKDSPCIPLVPFNQFQGKIKLRARTANIEAVGEKHPSCKDGSGRRKERTIREVVEKVTEWREYCIKENLNSKAAADKVGLPKKTLDDYFLLLLFCIDEKYNLTEKADLKIGVLRGFVRRRRQERTLSGIKRKKLNNEDEYVETSSVRELGGSN